MIEELLKEYRMFKSKVYQESAELYNDLDKRLAYYNHFLSFNSFMEYLSEKYEIK